MDNESQGATAPLLQRHHSLPSGGEVTFRDPTVLRAKDKKYVIDHVRDDVSDRGRSLDAIDGTLAMVIEQWTVPYLPSAPLPRDQPWILGELTVPDYDYLQSVIGPAVRVLFPVVDQADVSPGSPTGPASD